MRGIIKKAAVLLTSTAILLGLCACGDGPIMRVVPDKDLAERNDLLPRENVQRSDKIAGEYAAENSSGLSELKMLVDEKYGELEKTAKKAYLSSSKYYISLAKQLKSDSDSVAASIELLADFESAVGQEIDAPSEYAAPLMTEGEYAEALERNREKLLELWGELDDINARFDDYMSIMNALVNHNGMFGLITAIKQRTWEGSFPTGYFFNDDIPEEDGVSLLLDGSEYVKRFGVKDAELYALAYESVSKEDTLKLIETMCDKGVLTSSITDEDGLQWYGSWIDIGGRTCYYFIWYKSGGLGSIVEKFIGHSAERIIVAGSFDYMSCVLATLNK